MTSPRPELSCVRAEHASAILAFELANRSCFTSSISDRSDERFERFGEKQRDLLAEQASGRARTSHSNVASQEVLARAGFVAAGTTAVGTRRGILSEADLTAPLPEPTERS